ncbi:MAG TPA: ABC transporter substrate-binding protein [Candidatus Binatia bacterium]
MLDFTKNTIMNCIGAAEKEGNLTDSSKQAMVSQNCLARIRLPCRRLAYRFTASLVLLPIIAACRSPSSDRPPGYLVAGIESYPLDLDPRYATDANGVRVGNLIYNSLLRADQHSRLQPEIAERWRMTDATTYVFDLRRGVQFHDGRPLTARDVKFTYESILDPRNRSPKLGLLKPLLAVNQLGAYQVGFRLSAPHAPFVEQFTLGIVPAGSPSEAAVTYRAPPGSGPFMLEAMESGEKVTLRRNPNYWDEAPPLPGVIFKNVPDALVRVLEFEKGHIDFMQNDLEPDMIPWLRKHSAAKVDARPGTTFQYIGINLTHPILKNVKVRQALACAIDRDGIVRHLLKDTGTVASGLLSPLNWAYLDDTRSWPYDPARARQLLDEAGFPDPDGDGPLPRFRLSFKTTNIDLRRRIAEAIKEQLQQVGIDLEIRSYEWATFYSDVKKGNFHLYSLAWVGVMDPDIFYQIFHSASVPPAGDNRGRYSNPALDRLLEQGRSTEDLSKRKRIYGEVQRILADDLPYVPLWWWKNVIVQTPALQNFTPYPDGDLISLKHVTLH